MGWSWKKLSKKTFGDEGWSPSDKITGLLKLLLRDTFTNIRLILTFYSWDDNRQNKFQKSNKHFKQIIYLVVAVILIWMVTRRWWAWSNRKPEKTDLNVLLELIDQDFVWWWWWENRLSPHLAWRLISPLGFLCRTHSSGGNRRFLFQEHGMAWNILSKVLNCQKF